MSEKITATVEVTVQIQGQSCDMACMFLNEVWHDGVFLSAHCGLFMDALDEEPAGEFTRCEECLATFPSGGDEI